MTDPLLCLRLANFSEPVVDVGFVTGSGRIQVVPDHFGNTKRAFEQLRVKGCRRIGLVLDREMATAYHRFTAAYLGSCHEFGVGTPHILIVDKLESSAAEVARLAGREELDGVLVGPKVAPKAVYAALGDRRRRPKIVGFAGVYEADRRNRLSGMDECWKRTGGLAMHHLARVVENRRLGALEHNEIILLPGTWVEWPEGG